MIFLWTRFNRLRPGDTHIFRPSFIQIMVYRLFGTKPLSEPMLTYHYDLWEQISVKWFVLVWFLNKITNHINFHNRNAFEMSSAKWQPFYSGLIKLNLSPSRQCWPSPTTCLAFTWFPASDARVAWVLRKRCVTQSDLSFINMDPSRLCSDSVKSSQIVSLAESMYIIHNSYATATYLL